MPDASPTDRPKVSTVKHPGKSRITNGTSFLPGVDGRSLWIRRAKDLVVEHLQDLGGADTASAAERSLVRRSAVITTELEILEAKFAVTGGADQDDLELYFRGSNNLRRLLETLGLRRRPRDITPDPLAYARELEHEPQPATSDASDASGASNASAANENDLNIDRDVP